MNREEFISELNKRPAYFDINHKRYAHILGMSIVTDGKEKKLQISQEECAELIQAISKNLRGISKDNADILEELADVKICIDMIATVCKLTPSDVQRAIDVKIERERKRLNSLGITDEEIGIDKTEGE